MSPARRQRESLRIRGHRPYPLPARAWVGGQSWEHLLFSHWSVEPSSMERVVPAGLELDLFDGRAWLGIVPFRLLGLRPRLLPPVPTASTFLETNVRTYVRRGGRSGVYFFSLDATSRLAVQGARTLFHLPYRHAHGRVTWDASTRYRMTRTDRAYPAASLDASYHARGPAREPVAGSLEHFLVERYCLFADRRDGRIMRTDIHHRPWVIHEAEGELAHHGLIPPELAIDDLPLLHVAARQDVVFWRPVPA